MRRPIGQASLRAAASIIALVIASCSSRTGTKYAAFLGHVQLTRSVPAALPQTPRSRKALVAEMTAALVGGSTR